MKSKTSLRLWSYKLIIQTNLMVLCLMTLAIILFMGLSIRFLSMHLSASVTAQMTQLLESDMDISYNFFAEPYILVESSAEKQNLNLIEFKIYEDTLLAYETPSAYFQMPKILYENSLIRWINPESTAHVTDESSGTAYKIEVALNDQLIALVFILFLTISLAVSAFVFIFSRVVAHAFSHKLVIPINKLNEKIKTLSEENLKPFELEPLKFESPLFEIKALTQNTNAVMKKIAHHSQQLSNKNAIIEAQMNELSAIFNSIDQGILYFGETLIVESTFSSFCKSIFETEISGKAFSTLLKLEANEEAFLNEVLLQIFKSDKAKAEVFLCLLPSEIKLFTHELHLDYKFIQNSSGAPILMVILSDLTLTNTLYRQLESDQVHLKRLVKCFTNTEDINTLIQDLKEFLWRWENTPGILMDDAFIRDIHTFKGNFSLFHFEHTVTELNALENQLLYAKDSTVKYDLVIENALDQDMQMVSQSIGKNIFERPLMLSSKTRSLKKQLEIYSEYTMTLAKEYDKKLKPIEITGNDIQLSIHYYKHFFRSLIHIYKNIICHGIEAEDERTLHHKDPYGQIMCAINIIDNGFKLIISDDGRGIDLEKIKAKRATNDSTQEPLASESLFQLIFNPGFSTEETKNNHSGMGVGLYALDQEIKRLGGHISVKSTQFIGTAFTIELPILQEVHQNKAILNFLTEFSSNLNAQLQCAFQVENSNEKLSLLDFTAVIKIGPPIHSMVFLSMNLSLIDHLISHFFRDEEAHYDRKTLHKETLSEIANVLLGNCLKAFDAHDSPISFGHPEVIESQNAFVENFNLTFIGNSYHLENFNLNLYFIPFESLENYQEV